ncbi:MAG: leucine-rich repeat protein [Clostridia bacterium]|nr:leucine-rich repeat protein [Clostridia bacterium]
MIIKNKRKIISMAVAMAILMSCSTSFAEDSSEADPVQPESVTSEADASADTTVNERDAPDFAAVLAGSSMFDDIDIGISSEVDIELPTTSNNKGRAVKAPEQTQPPKEPEVTSKPLSIDADVDLNAVRSGSCGNHLNWEVGTTNNYIWNNTNAARYLLFEGYGAMNDYSSSSSPAWRSWLSSGTPVSYLVFDGNITHIGDYAFYGARSLTNIVASEDDIVKPTWPYTLNIPDTVTSIGSNAFRYAQNPNIWNIPNSVTEIGTDAFKNAHNNATIIIDNYKDAITGAPWGLPSGNVIWLRSISEEPDENEPELAKYNLQINGSGELSKIEDWTLLNDNGNGTYTSTSTNKTYAKLTNIPKTGDLSDGTVVEVISIADGCFENCTTIDSTVDIANSVTSIGSSAFSGSSVSKLSIDNFAGAVSGTSWGVANVEYLRDFSFAEISAQPYTGYAITPSVSITLTGTYGTVYETLAQGRNFTAAYSNNVNAGEATVNVTYLGAYSIYTGTHNSAAFNITRSDISGEVTVADLGAYPYTGSAVEPEPYVRLGEKVLVKGRDYTVAYLNNTVASDNAKCIITFTGGYNGSITKLFRITEAAYTITYSGTPVRYNFGNVPFVDFNGITLHCADDTEFTGYDIGSIGILEEEGAAYSAGATISIWCSDWNPELANHGVYIGGAPIILTLTVEKLVFTQDDVVDMSIETYDGESLDYTSAPYWVQFPDKQCTGQEIEIPFDGILWCGEDGLSAGYDFTYSYRDNIRPGTGYVVIDFNYHNQSIGGVIEIPFNIVATDIGDMVISGYDASYTYTGSYIRPTIRVTNNGAVLRKDTDYTLNITNNLNVGTATITVTGINSYSGTTTAHFDITPKSGDDVSISPIGDVIFSGIANTPGIEVIDNNR